MIRSASKIIILCSSLEIMEWKLSAQPYSTIIDSLYISDIILCLIFAVMIKKLPQAVINEIAAGQVIQRPANVIKELVENSIDAKSTQITVSIALGGMKSIKIIDNGNGVLVDDFELLCTRFATSKIKQFSDLKLIQSFGFRGEALASLSYVSNLVITSRNKDKKLGYQATFKDENIISGPKELTCNIGTKIIASDLFFNMENRRTSLNPAEQKKKIIRLLSHFCLQYPAIKFSLQSEKGDESLPSVWKNIRQGQNLPQIKMKIFQQITKLPYDKFIYVPEMKLSTDQQFMLQCILSKLNSCKGKTILLNINNRIIENQDISKAVDSAYSMCYQSIHEDIENYFVYLNIHIDSRKIDCNVHPTKKSIGLFGGHHYYGTLTQFIVNKIKKQSAIKMIIKSEATSKDFQSFRQKIDLFSSQRVADSQNPEPIEGRSNIQKTGLTSKSTKQSGNTYAYEKNRTDSKQIPLNYFFNKSQNNPQVQAQIDVKEQSNNTNQLPQLKESFKPTIQPLKIKLKFQQTETLEKSQQTRLFFQQITYVGCYGLNYILVHHQNRLYMMNIQPFIGIYIQNKLKQQPLPLKKLTVPVNVSPILQKFIQTTKILPNVDQAVSWIRDNIQLLNQQYGIVIEKELEITHYLCIDELLMICTFYDMETQLAYYLCRIYHNHTKERSQEQRGLASEKIIEEFLKSQFKQQTTKTQQISQNINPFNEQISRFYRDHIIPVLKMKVGVLDRNRSEKIALSENKGRYMKLMLDLKDVYKIFERC